MEEMVVFKGKWLDSKNFRANNYPLTFTSSILVVVALAGRSCRHSPLRSVLGLGILVFVGLLLYYFIRSRIDRSLGKVTFDNALLSFETASRIVEEYAVTDLKAIEIKQHTYAPTSASNPSKRNAFTGNNLIMIVTKSGETLIKEFSIDSFYMEKKMLKLLELWREKGVDVNRVFNDGIEGVGY